MRTRITEDALAPWLTRMPVPLFEMLLESTITLTPGPVVPEVLASMPR